MARRREPTARELEEMEAEDMFTGSTPFDRNWDEWRRDREAEEDSARRTPPTE